MFDIDNAERVTITMDGTEKTYVLIKEVDALGTEVTYGTFTPPQGILKAEGYYVPLGPKKAIKKIRKLVKRYKNDDGYYGYDLAEDIHKLLDRVR